MKTESYTYEQFYQITIHLLYEQRKVKEEIELKPELMQYTSAKMKSADVRDYVKIGRMAKSIEDVNFIVDTF